MSPRGSSEHGPYRKPQADIYTVLLVIALLAVILGCLFLYFEVADYPDTPPWSGAPTAQLGTGRETTWGLSQFSRRGLSRFSRSENGTVPFSTAFSPPLLKADPTPPDRSLTPFLG